MVGAYKLDLFSPLRLVPGHSIHGACVHDGRLVHDFSACDYASVVTSRQPLAPLDRARKFV